MSKHISVLTSKLKGRLLTAATKCCELYGCSTVTQLYVVICLKRKPHGVGNITLKELIDTIKSGGYL